MVTLKEILDQYPKGLTLDGVQELQAEFDRRFVDDYFVGFDKIRHTYAHMGKLFGRLAEYVQMIEDGHEFSPEEVEEKVIPDLMVYSAWLAGELGVNIEQSYLRRMVGNIDRLHKDKIGPEELEEFRQAVESRY